MDRPRVIEKLTDSDFKIGVEVYKIVGELGRGGNGVAFLCHNSKNQKAVAKVYLPPDKRDLDESPGLRGTSYSGKTFEENHNPNGVVAVFTHAPNENEIAATALRLMIFVER
jgi:hypothetical protein